MSKCNYFTVDDLIRSTTASKQGIDNQPSATIQKELEMTVHKLNFITIIVHIKGATIRVTSGYRCKRLNELVGGVKTSLHMQGRAVDFVVSDDRVKNELYESLINPVVKKTLGICEVIKYQSFLHVGFSKSY